MTDLIIPLLKESHFYNFLMVISSIEPLDLL